MAYITKRIDTKNDLTVFTVTGKVPAGEIIAAIRDFFEAAVTSNVCWDFSESDLSEIKTPDVKLIADLSSKYTYKRPSGKTAIVGTDDFTYGLLRMYEIIKDCSELPILTQAFRSIEEAYEWLTGTRAAGDE